MKAGVIGVGGYGGSHVEALLLLEKEKKIEFTCFCEVDISKCKEDADELIKQGKRYYSDYIEMLDKEELDIVGIPCPIHLHKTMFKEAISRGINVMLEKPPCVAIQDLDEMEQLLEKSEKICAVGFQNTVSDSIHYLVKRLNEGVIGEVKEVIAVGFYKRNLNYYNRNSWAGKQKIDGEFVMDGTMNNPLSHLLNASLYLASKNNGHPAFPKDVQAELYRINDIEGDDTACVRITTEEDVTVCYYATTCGHQETVPYVKVIGTKGQAVWDYRHICRIETEGNSEEIKFDEGNLVYRNFKNLADCVENRDNNLISPLSDTRAFVLASNGAYNSSKNVYVIADEYIEVSENKGTKALEIKDIEKIFESISCECKLPSEANIPWGVSTEKVNVTGLKKFDI